VRDSITKQTIRILLFASVEELGIPGRAVNWRQKIYSNEYRVPLRSSSKDKNPTKRPRVDDVDRHFAPIVVSVSVNAT
jgi:hypothetical protein